LKEHPIVASQHVDDLLCDARSHGQQYYHQQLEQEAQQFMMQLELFVH
jgi:hypothetical protein